MSSEKNSIQIRYTLLSNYIIVYISNGLFRKDNCCYTMHHTMRLSSEKIIYKTIYEKQKLQEKKKMHS